VGLDDKWSEIIRNSDGTILRMLKYFYISKKGPVRKADLYKNIKKYCKDIGGAPQLVEQLREFSEFYTAVRKEEGPGIIKKYFTSLGCKVIASEQDKFERIHIALQGLRLFKVSQAFPLIDAAITSFTRNGGGNSRSLTKALIRLLESMEKYHFINNAVCDRIGNEVEKLYADCCVEYARSDDFEKTTNEFLGTLKKQVASEEEFRIRFCEISYSQESIPLVAYIFDRMSNAGLDPGERVHMFNPERSLRRKSHNIEHFYPQKPSSDMTPNPDMLEGVDNIGNLLAISFRTNSSLGNLSPRKKLDELKGRLAKRIQNLHYVNSFIHKYEKLADSWDRNAIAKRASDLATEAYREVWQFN